MLLGLQVLLDLLVLLDWEQLVLLELLDQSVFPEHLAQVVPLDLVGQQVLPDF